MQKQYTTLEVEAYSSHVQILYLNRPSVCNAINSVMMRELLQFWSDIAVHDRVRAVVLTGRGEKAFCAGADLKERQGISEDEWREQHAVLQQAMRAMVSCAVPVISAVNGVAYGGGLELVLASDFAYACDSAVFAQSEVKLGIMPGAMGTQNLSRAVGLRRAKELTFSGRSFTAEDGLGWGLLNRVLSQDELLSETIRVAENIALNAPLSVRGSKAAIDCSWNHDVQSGYSVEIEHYNQLLSTKDRVEGIDAFNEKRVADFKGE